MQGLILPTLVMATFAIILLSYGYSRGDGSHVAGVKYALNFTWKVIPLLIFAFLIAGMANSLLPPDAVKDWIGDNSGIKGIALGTLAGALTPGGPMLCLPIAAGLASSGAAIGAVVAYLTAWSLYSLPRVFMEIGILGWKLAGIRLIVVLIFAPIAGLIAQTVFGYVSIRE
ncbi:MAG: permease [Nitrospinota bacterium]